MIGGIAEMDHFFALLFLVVLLALTHGRNLWKPRKEQIPNGSAQSEDLMFTREGKGTHSWPIAPIPRIGFGAKRRVQKTAWHTSPGL